MKLRCLRHYANGGHGLLYQPGEEFEASAELWMFLRADSPGTFEQVVEAKEIVVPPVDKAVKSPPRSKARTRRARSKKDETS